ncbi:MAG: D-alanine--D-alanine ligase [Planctomycetes bacterium]|nr:D-alanine--D-alanine ligase [Planctomycetota bacterium]
MNPISKHAKMVVAVLAGGPDAERPVSIASGTAIATALRQSGRFDDVRYLLIDRLDTVEQLRETIGNADVVFPALHGHWGEGGPLQALLEADGRPFVGCGSKAAALAMDKMECKWLVNEPPLSIPTPAACELRSVEDGCAVEPPLVLKPVDDGSSVDIRICHDEASVVQARRELHPKRARLMAEQYIAGGEFTVGIIGDEVSSLIEIVPTVAFYDYEAKYDRDDTGYVIEPDTVSDKLKDQMRAWALAIHRAVGARHLSRVDFRLEEGTDIAWFLEINTMPGFTSHSLVPMGAAACQGLEMPELCAKLVEMAMAR